MGLLAWVLPDEAAMLVLIGIAFALIVGLRRVARGLSGLLAFMLVAPVFLPLIDGALGAMPLWLMFVAFGVLCLALLRGALAMLLGPQAASEAVGHLAAEAILGVLRLFFLPMRLLFRGRR